MDPDWEKYREQDLMISELRYLQSNNYTLKIIIDFDRGNNFVERRKALRINSVKIQDDFVKMFLLEQY